MRQAHFLFLAVVTFAACQNDSPLEPNLVDLHASLQGPPDLSGQLPQFERRVFIHYRRGFERPEGRGKPGGGGGTSSCYSLLGNGARWKTVEPYRSTFGLPVATWEFNNDIFGPSQGGGVPPFTGDMDGINTAQFGDYPEPNVIAVTVVWGIFAGPPSQRELVEWDLLMNEAEFEFGDADRDASVMDIENIAVHELGHAAGLGHPSNSCTEETMYAYADFGETKKRTLEAGDIAGILELY